MDCRRAEMFDQAPPHGGGGLLVGQRPVGDERLIQERGEIGAVSLEAGQSLAEHRRPGVVAHVVGEVGEPGPVRVGVGADDDADAAVEGPTGGLRVRQPGAGR